MPGASEEPVTVSQSAEVEATWADAARVDAVLVSTVLVSEVRRRLAQAADPERAPQMQAYMKSSMPFRGVSAVPMRKICREVFDEHRLPDRDAWTFAVLRLWDDARFREERYAAIALTGHRYYRDFQDVSTLVLYQHVVITGGWWDFVDTIASNRVGPILRANVDIVRPMMRSWAAHEDLWVRRTAILCQLGSKGSTDLDLLTFAIVQNLEGSKFGREFFVRKAIGWALREYAKSDEAWVVSFARDHADQMSGLSRREALKNVG